MIILLNISVLNNQHCLDPSRCRDCAFSRPPTPPTFGVPEQSPSRRIVLRFVLELNAWLLSRTISTPKKELVHFLSCLSLNLITNARKCTNHEKREACLSAVAIFPSDDHQVELWCAMALYCTGSPDVKLKSAGSTWWNCTETQLNIVRTFLCKINMTISKQVST